MSSADAPRKPTRGIRELILPIEGRIIEYVKMNVPSRLLAPTQHSVPRLQDGHDLNLQCGYDGCLEASSSLTVMTTPPGSRQFTLYHIGDVKPCAKSVSRLYKVKVNSEK